MRGLFVESDESVWRRGKSVGERIDVVASDRESRRSSEEGVEARPG